MTDPMLDNAAVPAGVRRPPGLLRALLAGGVATGLLLIAGLLLDRFTFSPDRAILAALRVPGHPETPIGPHWLFRVMSDITSLGSTAVLILVVLAALAILLARGLKTTALLLACATISGSLTVVAAKLWIARARPPLVSRLAEVTDLSFPSGHSANSAIIYLTLASLFAQVTRGRAERNVILGTAGLLVLLIGLSRIYLGVHWTSDVLAGWSFGALWALAWWWAGAKARASIGGEQPGAA